MDSVSTFAGAISFPNHLMEGWRSLSFSCHWEKSNSVLENEQPLRRAGRTWGAPESNRKQSAQLLARSALPSSESFPIPCLPLNCRWVGWIRRPSCQSGSCEAGAEMQEADVMSGKGSSGRVEFLHAPGWLLRGSWWLAEVGLWRGPSGPSFASHSDVVGCCGMSAEPPWAPLTCCLLRYGTLIPLARGDQASPATGKGGFG